MAETASPAQGLPTRKPVEDRSGTVGRALRTVYDDMLREDVPKDFIDLLRKLD